MKKCKKLLTIVLCMMIMINGSGWLVNAQEFSEQVINTKEEQLVEEETETYGSILEEETETYESTVEADTRTYETAVEEKMNAYKTEYFVITKVKTDGIENNIGGTLTPDLEQGFEGDIVTLKPVVNKGYQFVGYESLLTDTGLSTDGLLTIKDNQFELNSKTGNVTIIAKFITRKADPDVVFEDEFWNPELDPVYMLGDMGKAVIENGELKLDTINANMNYVLLKNNTLEIQENNGEGYRIEVDTKKLNATPGTMHIAFRTGSEGISNRYVLALNGSLAIIRHINNSVGKNEELARVNYTYNTVGRKISIIVKENQVSISSAETPLLSYTLPEGNTNWSGTEPSVAFVNMTNGATVSFDNVAVKKIIPKYQIKLGVTKDGIADTGFEAGTVKALPEYAASGEEVTLTVTAKTGYRFKDYSIDNVTAVKNKFTMPYGLSEKQGIVVIANFVEEQLREAKSFYIDSNGGSDENSGESEEAPWKTLTKIAKMKFVPGDKILIKTDSVFNGTGAALRFLGSGTVSKEILVSSYGTGAKPQLNGQGQITNVVELRNQEYITIEKLEITNLDSTFCTTFGLNESNNTTKILRGVNVYANDFGIVHNITIKDLYIHDINGNISNKWNGGIFFDVTGTVSGGKILGIPTKYDGILVENCLIEKTDRSAIKLVNSVWTNQSAANNPTVPLNWYPSTNVIVRSNVIRQVGGDGITVRDTEGALIEYNAVGDCRYQKTGYNAGIWPFQATNTVVQYNEVYRTRGTQDGQGLDCDHVSSYNLMQYNYSHDNYGGFMLIMNGFPHTAPTVRYNVSQNDKDKSFEFSRGLPAGTMIYNNTIYSDSVLTGRGGIFDVANSGAGTGNSEVFIFNNIFWYPKGQAIYCGEGTKNKGKFKLTNNAYWGGVIPPAEDTNPITKDPKLSDIGKGPANNIGNTPVTGKFLTNQLDGYKLLKESPLINAGISVEEVVAKFNGTVTDRRSMAPAAIHDLAKSGKSIDYVMGRNYPAIQGVSYNKDFFGKSTTYNRSNPDIGAMEYQGKGSSAQEGEIIFEDAFEGNSLNTTQWVKYGNGTASAAENVLTLSGSSGGTAVVSKMNMQKKDYEIEVDLTITDPSKNGNYWIGFRHNTMTNERYALRYHNSGNFYFAKLTGKDSFLNKNDGISNVGSPHPFALAANRKYHIKIRVEGNLMTAWIDGQRILSYEDKINSFTEGGVSLWANWTYNGSFSDLVVRDTILH